jgi:hypothetical protein
MGFLALNNFIELNYSTLQLINKYPLHYHNSYELRLPHIRY